VRNRIARRVAIVAIATIVPVLVSAGPALAKLKPDDGEVSGPSLGVGNTILLFVVVPLGAFLIIAGLALLPSALSRPRYRPGRPWDHAPRWIGRPAEVAVAAPAEAGTGAAPGTVSSDSTARGGASAEW